VFASSAFECYNCIVKQLSELDVSTCTGLSALDCSYNRLQGLDVSACTALESLDCSGNGLTSLNVGGCRALTALWCHDNALSALNVNDGLNLETLMCWNNALSALDISRNAKLKNLNAANNEMLLSTLAKQLQLVETYGIEHYAASPQTPSVTLEAGEDYDLSREWTFDGEETDITVEDLDGNPLPENWYVLDADQKSIRINKDGIYRIRLRNLALRCNEYEESTGLFTDERYMMACIITAGVGDLEPETATFAWQAEAAGDKTFSFVCKGGLTVDWGDGATDTYAGSESLAVAASHQYAKAGHYKVQVAAQSFMSGIVGLYIVEAGLTAIDVQAAVSLTALDAHGNRLKLSEVAALIPALDEAGVKHVLTPQARDTTVKVRKKINISAETSFNGTETDIRVYDAEDGEIESGFRLDAKELTFTKAGDYTVRFTNAGLGTYADLTATAPTAAEMVWQVTVTPSSPSTPSDPSDPSDPGKPSNPGNPGTPSDPGSPGTPSDPTANEQASAAAPFAYVQGRTVYLCDGLGEVEAFTAMGQRVYKGFDRAFTLPHIGIYVVRVTADGRRCKIIVR
ncbi:MAG: hypothetical protein K2L03_01600, partial [Bacteroidales bacterium]|nr:hypothetical protein [Bacteroidales bacterium]